MARVYDTTAIPKMISNSTPSGLAFSSTSFSTSFAPWYAFDQIDNNEGWITQSGVLIGHVGYIFTNSIAIGKYAIRSGGILNELPKDWTFEGSNDTTTGSDGTWVVLDTQTSQNWTTYNTDKEFEILNTKKYKAYRVKVSSNNGHTGRSGLNELKMYELMPVVNKFLISSENGAYQSVTTDYINATPIMTSNTSPLGVVKSSDNNTSAWLAFNGAYKTSSTDGWYYPSYASPAWLSYEFTVPRKINRYTLSPIATIQAPKTWIFQASNDGINWVNLDSQTNIIFSDVDLGVGRTFTFENEIAYKIYRILITLNNGSTTLSIDELKMFEKNYKLKLISNGSETTFLNHGLNKLTAINPADSFSNRNYIESSTTPLGSGKVFKQKIDTTKTPIKKASIT